MAKIIRLICAPFDSGEIFDIQNSQMDYENLSCQINILAAALTDIDRQVRAEREDKAVPTLEAVCAQIAALHGKIGELHVHVERLRR